MRKQQKRKPKKLQKKQKEKLPKPENLNESSKTNNLLCMVNIV